MADNFCPRRHENGDKDHKFHLVNKKILQGLAQKKKLLIVGNLSRLCLLFRCPPSPFVKIELETPKGESIELSSCELVKNNNFLDHIEFE